MGLKGPLDVAVGRLELASHVANCEDVVVEVEAAGARDVEGIAGPHRLGEAELLFGLAQMKDLIRTRHHNSPCPCLDAG